MTKLEELKAALEAATKGEWDYFVGNNSEPPFCSATVFHGEDLLRHRLGVTGHRGDLMIINIPFAGFYNTTYDRELDEQLTQQATHYVEEENPDTLLEEDVVQQIMFDHMDWGAAHRHVCQAYVNTFCSRFHAEFGLDLRLEFEKMTSPKEYNFQTDRAWAIISEEKARALFELVPRAALEKAIKGRFTSCDGFISFYSNRIDDWLEKPIEEWDYNELGTLLYAMVDDNFEMDCFYELNDDGVFYIAIQEGMNWAHLEQKLRVEELEAAGECEEDAREFPLGILSTAEYVRKYEHINHLKE